jgi:hypothetical protein
MISEVIMKMLALAGLIVVAMASWVAAAGDYSGDVQCRPPKDWSSYSEPYYPQDHPNDYPTFHKADRPGWVCSYNREDGVIVQFGDSRTPQEQWIATWIQNND